MPLTSRGAGTSVAGNAVGRGIVLDFSRHLNRVLEVDPEARTAVVEPGTVHAVLQKAVDAARRPLRAGPVDPPALHDRRDDRQQRLRLAVAGLRPHLRQRGRAGAADRGGGEAHHRAVRRSAAPARSSTTCARPSAEHLATARTEFDRFGRQVSGYAVQHLLPERST